MHFDSFQHLRNKTEGKCFIITDMSHEISNGDCPPALINIVHASPLSDARWEFIMLLLKTRGLSIA
jgi:hypothetical protein